jgi:nickel-dependent lactate racemase
LLWVIPYAFVPALLEEAFLPSILLTRMILQLPFGTDTVRAEFRPPRRLVEVKAKRIATLQKPEEILGQALHKPIGCFPFEQIFRKAGKVLIVAPNNWHDAGGMYYLPILLKRLGDCGVPMSEISILVAGAWGAKRNGIASLLESCGSEPMPAVYYHDPCDAHALEYIGETRRGTPVFVNRLLVDAAHVLVCGQVSHHSFWGYRGGPAMIVPECAGKETIERHLHLAYDARLAGLHPRCRDGVVAGNPLQEDLREAFRFLNVDFLLHTLVNENGQVVGAVAGEPLQAHAAGCRLLDDIYRVPLEEAADLAIVSCGGYPHDANYCRAHEALHRAVQTVQPGSNIIFVAECRHGLGSPVFAKWFMPAETMAPEGRLPSRSALENLLAISTRQIAQQNEVIAVTSMPAETVRALGFTPASSLAEALQLAHPRTAEVNSCYIFSNGAITVPQLS